MKKLCLLVSVMVLVGAGAAAQMPAPPAITAETPMPAYRLAFELGDGSPIASILTFPGAEFRLQAERAEVGGGGSGFTVAGTLVAAPAPLTPDAEGCLLRVEGELRDGESGLSFSTTLPVRVEERLSLVQIQGQEIVVLLAKVDEAAEQARAEAEADEPPASDAIAAVLAFIDAILAGDADGARALTVPDTAFFHEYPLERLIEGAQWATDEQVEAVKQVQNIEEHDPFALVTLSGVDGGRGYQAVLKKHDGAYRILGFARGDESPEAVLERYQQQ